MSVWMCSIPLCASFTATHWACKAVLVLIWLRLCAQSTVQSRDNLGGSPSGRGLGTWTGRKRADTHTARLTRRLSQITWTIRSFKRISQCKGAALESRAPDGYWFIVSLRTDTCDGRRRRCFLLGCGRACDLASSFSRVYGVHVRFRPGEFGLQRKWFRTGTCTKTEGATRLSWSATQNNNPYLIKQRRERERVRERQLLSHNHPSQSTQADLNIRKQSCPRCRPY